MVSKESKMVSPDLKKLGLQFDNPLDWIPRDGQSLRPLSPGLEEITWKAKEYNRFGVNDSTLKIRPKCRFCGSDMFFVVETNNAIIYGCPYELCPNNPENKQSTYFYAKASAKRRIGQIKEDLFGE